LGPEDLTAALTELFKHADADRVLGFSSGADTGVFKFSDNLAIVQTVDFLTPIVDDPYEFGRIAAANALSDIYTAAARPVTALNILAFPCELGTDVAARILKGGADTVAKAGAVILGGHTVNDVEPKYGLAVTGVGDAARLITNEGAKPGDVLVLTKKIGTGILNSATKLSNGVLQYYKGAPPDISAAVFAEATASMMRLNKSASEAMVDFGATACTDITGFGLLGHARILAQNSGVAISVEYSRTPVYDGVEAFAIPGTKGGGERNHDWVKKALNVSPAVGIDQLMTLCDPQTSGGLLICVPEKMSDKLLKRLIDGGDEASAIIGSVEKGLPGSIRILP